MMVGGPESRGTKDGHRAGREGSRPPQNQPAVIRPLFPCLNPGHPPQNFLTANNLNADSVVTPWEQV